MGKFTVAMNKSQPSKGLELKLARIQRGLHLYQVARQLSISAARLSQYEGGHRQIPPRLEKKLRSLLGIAQRRRRVDEK
ncbi:helix-turn-helix domain-containing protein [Chloroflexota bacterium]